MKEFEISKINENSFYFNYIAEGFDKELEISYKDFIDEKTIISTNKNNFIKIWKKVESELPKIDLVKENKEYIIKINYNNSRIYNEKEKKKDLKSNKKEYKLKEKGKKII